MKMKRYLLMILLLLPVLAFAQIGEEPDPAAEPVLVQPARIPAAVSGGTAADMDAMLAAKTVSAAGAARFILASADLLPAGLSGSAAERAAYDMASSKGWIKKTAEENVTLKDTAFLIMKAFDLKGGIMYSLLKNPRYAYREMVYRKLIQGASDPDMNVTGARLIQILGKTINYSSVEGRQ